MSTRQHIFLSYSSREADFALRLAADLKNRGVRVWMDRLDLQPGDDWRKSLQEAINQSVAIIAVVSQAYVESSYCQRELARADRLKMSIIPVRLEPVPANDWPFEIERHQYVDFTNRHLPGVYEAQLANLVSYIEQQFAGQKGSAPSPHMRYVLNLMAQLHDGKRVYTDPADDDENWHNPTEARSWLLKSGIDVLDRPEDYHALTDIQTRTRVSLADPTDLLDFYPQMIVIGKPGSGKTAIIDHIALHLAHQYRETNGEALFPFRISMNKWDNHPNLLEFISQQWPLDGDVIEAIAEGTVVPLLDGLDEIRASNALPLADIKAWLESDHSPKYLILTSRAWAYPNIDSLGLPVLYAGDLTQQQIDAFIRESLSKSLYETLSERLTQDRRLATIATNPFVLQSVVDIIGRSPDGTLPESFGVIMHHVVRSYWDRAVQRGAVPTMRFSQLKKPLARLAFEMLKDPTEDGFSRQQTIDILGQTATLQVAERIGFLTRYQDHISFVFDELKLYFAAAWLTLKPADLVYLDDLKLATGPYNQLMDCVCALASDPQGLFKKIIRSAPRAALHCLARGMPVFEDTLTTIVEAAVQNLGTRDDVTDDDVHEIADQFSHLDDAVILPLLLGLARDGESNQRLMAGRLLSEMTFPTIDSLRESLADELDEDEQAATASGLRQLGSIALPTILRLIHDDDEIVRHNAIWAAAELRDQAAVPVLTEVLKNGDTETILAALDALHHLRDPASLPSIVETLGNRSKQIRNAAAEGLYWFREASVPLLLSVLQNDTRLLIRLEAMKILARVDDELVTTTLLAATYDDDPRIRAAAIEALQDKKGADVIKRLKECLKDQALIGRSKRRVCDAAAAVLPKMRTTDAIRAVQEWQNDNAEATSKTLGDAPAVSGNGGSSRGSASTAAGRLRDRQDRIPHDVLEGLRSRDVDERQQSVRALANVNPELALLKLRQAIQDREVVVRIAAVEVAGSFTYPPAMPLLIEALNDEDLMVVARAGKAIAKYGEAAVASLQEAYPGCRAYARGVIVQTLATIGESSVEALIKCLGETATHKAFDKPIAEMAAAALEAIGTTEAIQAVHKWRAGRQEPDPMLDINKAINKQDEILLRLIQTIREDEWIEREEAFKALREYVKQIDDKHRSIVCQRLNYLLDDADWNIRWAATETLAWVGDGDVVDKLMPRLKDDNWMVRVAAIRALVEINDARAATPILDRLSDQHHVVREAAIEALGHFADPTAVPALIQFLKETDPFLRLAATEALSKIETPMAIHAVLQSLKDKDKHVRWAAAFALSTRATSQHITYLVEALKDTAKPYWEDIRVCDLVANALEHIGTPLANEAVQTWRQSEVTQSNPA